MTFGERLKELRENRGLFQKDIAELLGIGIPAISDYEKDKKKPRPKNLAKLAEFYGVTSDYLLTGEDNTIDNLVENFPAGVNLIRRADKELTTIEKERLTRLIKAFLDEK